MPPLCYNCADYLVNGIITFYHVCNSFQAWMSLWDCAVHHLINLAQFYCCSLLILHIYHIPSVLSLQLPILVSSVVSLYFLELTDIFKPVRSGYSCNDRSLSMPYIEPTKEVIPFLMLFSLAFAGPAATVNAIVPLLLLFSLEGTLTYSCRLSVWSQFRWARMNIKVNTKLSKFNGMTHNMTISM